MFKLTNIKHQIPSSYVWEYYTMRAILLLMMLLLLVLLIIIIIIGDVVDVYGELAMNKHPRN